MEISQLNEEKEAYEELKKEINKPLEVPEDKCNTFILYNIDNAKIIVNLIEKQQKEIEELKKDNNYQCEERCRLTFELQETEDRLSKIELQLLKEE